MDLSRSTFPQNLGDLGLGCAQLGDLFAPLSDEAAAAIVDAAWDQGVRYFDTAPHYGLGLSERRLGAALRSRSGSRSISRDDYVVSTKVGRLIRDGERVWDFSRSGVTASLAESLDRLGLDRVDIVLLHDPHESGQLDRAFGEGLETLLEFRRRGVIRAVGVGSADVPSLRRFVAETPVDVILLAGRYTLLDQRASIGLLADCAARGVTVLNAGVYNTGILATDAPTAGDHYAYGAADPAVAERARAIAAVCHSFGVRLPAAALGFSFTAPAVRTVVVGADTPAQVAETAALLRTPIPAALWPRLRELGLVA